MVHGFERGSDKLVLTAIDANSGAGGDQALTWIAGAALTGLADQVRYDGTVSGDVNGDGLGDFTIAMATPGHLGPNDFIL